ncbi:MAG: hypothetical protein ABI556_17570 [Gemmatimonadales bacterium]
MLVVVGSRHDSGACEIVRQWERWGAALLSCEDLSESGWRYSPSDRAASRAVVSGQIIPDTAIRGVLVRRPWVLQQELTQIVPADREFVAAEMSAFLLAWLSQLPCRVLNRPRGTSLCGPNWWPQQWAHMAANVGFQVEPIRLQIPAGAKAKGEENSYPAPQPVEAVVVGDRCLGDVSNDQAADAVKLAAAAGVALLAVWFVHANGRNRFVAANAMPDLKDCRVADAVREYLLAN